MSELAIVLAILALAQNQTTNWFRSNYGPGMLEQALLTLALASAAIGFATYGALR